MAVTSATSATTSTTATSRATIANNFDTFLLLLTTQLKNQNPLDPLDTNQFTQQLVQFAGVEQQIRTNESLEALVNLNKTSQLSTVPKARRPAPAPSRTAGTWSSSQRSLVAEK